MPKCNFAEIVRNKWFQHFNNKMTCLYEVREDNMICTFVQIENYRSWVKGGFY